MVRHHVAQRAGSVVEFAARSDIDQFGCSDLDVIDVIVVPERFDHHVGETRRHDVLHRFLAEEMVDAIDLAFVGLVQQPRIQRASRCKIVAERLFDRYPTESSHGLIGKPVLGQFFGNFAKELRRHREIECRIGARRMRQTT